MVHFLKIGPTSWFTMFCHLIHGLLVHAFLNLNWSFLSHRKNSQSSFIYLPNSLSYEQPRMLWKFPLNLKSWFTGQTSQEGSLWSRGKRHLPTWMHACMHFLMWLSWVTHTSIYNRISIHAFTIHAYHCCKSLFYGCML